MPGARQGYYSSWAHIFSTGIDTLTIALGQGTRPNGRYTAGMVDFRYGQYQQYALLTPELSWAPDTRLSFPLPSCMFMPLFKERSWVWRLPQGQLTLTISLMPVKTPFKLRTPVQCCFMGSPPDVQTPWHVGSGFFVVPIQQHL